jgi:hypothetical protein
MAFSDAGNNAMLDALGALITHVGMFTGATALTGVTGEADTDVLTKASHGLSNGDVVVFTSLTGGTGLKTLKPYYVRDVNGNDFKLAGVSGGAALNFTADITDATLQEITEWTGGDPAYARVAIAWGSSALGLMDDSTNGAAFNAPTGAKSTFVGFFSASTAGTLYAVDDLTEETFAAQGTYTLTDAKLNLNG